LHRWRRASSAIGPAAGIARDGLLLPAPTFGAEGQQCGEGELEGKPSPILCAGVGRRRRPDGRLCGNIALGGSSKRLIGGDEAVGDGPDTMTPQESLVQT
jgi:hypothetical protein